MIQSIAVIGANYGDEGKGLATDFFTRYFKSLVVARCNGGAQAGHTVVDGENRHVFSHVGSGFFAGAKTFLGAGFIVNPLALNSELKKLKNGDKIFASSDCRVATLYDMAINSLAEISRGKGRHGSCGHGINETVTRHAAGFFLTMDTIANRSYTEILERIEKIRNTWVPMRMLELKLSPRDFEGDEVAQTFLDILAISPQKIAEELMFLSENFMVIDGKELLPQAKLVVIEGAQGLMLDEFLGDFPHVTRSVTGLASHIRTAAEMGKTSISPIYMTRAYATRHGAGVFRFEGAKITDKELVDSTNLENKWQGAIRYAPLDLQMMKAFIRNDLDRAESVAQLFGVKIEEPKIFITCMDQLGEKVTISNARGEIRNCMTDKLVEFVEEQVGIKVIATSHGPTAADVRLTSNVL